MINIFFFTNTFPIFNSVGVLIDVTYYVVCVLAFNFYTYWKLRFFTYCFRVFSSELESSAGSEKEEAGSGNLLVEPRPRTTRPWTPLSVFNSDYVTLLKDRERTLIRHDFIRENIVSQMHIIMKEQMILTLV